MEARKRPYYIHTYVHAHTHILEDDIPLFSATAFDEYLFGKHTTFDGN